MTQMKDELRHAQARYEAPSDSLARFLRRTERARKTRRLGAAVVALTIGLVGALAVVVSSGEGVSDTTPGTDDLQPAALHGPGRIVFSRWQEGRWHLFSVNPDGSEERQLTHGIRDYSADVSTDGTKIVADTEMPGADGLLVMDVDGTDPVTFRVGDAIDPAWSPDGSRIAFSLDSGGDNCCLELWVMNADGSGLARLGNQHGYSPTWSPDGSKIAFILSGDGLEDATRIAVMDADGNGVTPISEPDWWGAPDWSPDGSSILTSLDSDPTRGSLVTIAIDGGEPEVIARLRLQEFGGASWSPDGDRIAYVSGEDGVWVIDADGLNTHRITEPGGNVENPSW